jgi:hypothetical protein
VDGIPIAVEPADRRALARAALHALLARYRAGDPGDRELIDRLFVDAGDGTGWLLAISELSVSFRPGRPATVRALSEIVRKRPLDRSLAARGLRHGTELLQAVAARASAPYGVALFRELYEQVYLRDAHGTGAPGEPAAWLRFGTALELGGPSPVVKVYFDLHAVPPERRRGVLAGIVERLGDAAGLEAWGRACPAIDLGTTRILGVDFGAGDAVRTKIYWGARDLTWESLAAALREVSGDRHLETLDRLRREVCGNAPGSLSSVLVSLAGAEGERSVKIDVCLARLFADDGGAYEAVERFRGASADGPTPLALLNGGLEPRQTRRVQQYLAVELPPSASPRVTVYYRPIGLETEHLGAAVRPGRCAG